MYNFKTKEKGFTLIELLIVIGIIAILAAAVIITVTPGERLKDAREATRESHLTAIGQAAHMMVVDQDVDNLEDAVAVCTGNENNENNVVDPEACGLSASVTDPLDGEYYVMNLEGDRVEVCTSADESAYECEEGGELVI